MRKNIEIVIPIEGEVKVERIGRDNFIVGIVDEAGAWLYTWETSLSPGDSLTIQGAKLKFEVHYQQGG